MNMFSRERLKKPARLRTQSAPAVQPLDSDKRFSIRVGRRRARQQPQREPQDEEKEIFNATCTVVNGGGSSSSSSFTVEQHLAKFSSSTPPTRQSTISNNNNRNKPLVKALVAALQKDHMMDVTLTGKKGVHVRASRYVLSCRCQALEDKLYSKKRTSDDDDDEEVYIGDYTEIAVKALVEYCFTGELVEFSKSHASAPKESCASNLEELSRLAHAHHFSPLKMEVHQLSRRLMNQHPSTACLFFSMNNNSTSAAVDTRTYAQQTLQECPNEALLSSTHNFVQRLPPSRLEALFEGETLKEMQELDKTKLLQIWSEGPDNNVAVAQRLSSKHVNLSRISLDDEDTLSSLKSSNLFDEDALSELQSSAASSAAPQERLTDEEHVVVKGAGMEAVNTVFIRDCSEQDMYLTECDTYTLYCWNGMWHIAASCDLSNSLYQCLAEESSSFLQEQVPSHGWQCVGASDPPPSCTWIAARGSESTLMDEDGELTLGDIKRMAPAPWTSSRELSSDYAEMD